MSETVGSTPKLESSPAMTGEDKRTKYDLWSQRLDLCDPGMATAIAAKALVDIARTLNDMNQHGIYAFNKP